MKVLKKTAIAAAVITSLGASTQAIAGLEGNIGATSNYIWRGVTQTNDRAAVSGGLDYSHDSGFYLGAWASNLDGSQYELDLYGGYGMDIGALGLDFGLISYEYPVEPDDYFREVYFNGSWSVLNFGVAYTFDSEDDSSAEFSSGDIYLSLGADFDLGNDWGVGAYIGDYDFDDSDGEDYTHYGVAVSKAAGDFGDLTFAIDKNDLDASGADDPRVSVSWVKTF